MENNFSSEITNPETQLSKLCYNSILDSHNFFLHNRINPLESNEGLKVRLLSKINDEYKHAYNAKPKKEDSKSIQPDGTTFGLEKDLEDIAIDLQNVNQIKTKKESIVIKSQKIDENIFKEQKSEPKSEIETIIEELKDNEEKLAKVPKKFLLTSKKKDETLHGSNVAQSRSNLISDQVLPYQPSRVGAIAITKMRKLTKPTWHPPWKLMRVISGHQGWVRCVAVDVSNQFFVTGSSDRTIKFWDLASGQLKLTLTGHINTVRGLALSTRHAYLYSCAEDKTVKCWDLEYNKVIRSYHGHLSGVYCLTLLPKLDVIATGGRDAVVRVWDIRTKAQIHTLGGHSNAVSAVISQEFEPQIVSGSHDSTIRLWDIGTGKCMNTLTNHKKSVRSLLFHHEEYTFASGAPENIKVFGIFQFVLIMI